MPLEQRFEMERGFRGDRFVNSAGVWAATDLNDGETYLLWLIRKTGSAVDHDIERLLRDTVRRVRGVLARQAAREALLDVLEIVEDDQEIGIRLYGADGPLEALPTKSRRRMADSARTVSGRVAIWSQIARLVRGLSYLHAADIVHGGIAEGAVFTTFDEPLELKLGGYEGCVHIGSVGNVGTALLRPGTVVSYGQDWRDLGNVAARLLFQGGPQGAVLLPPEQRLLDRLRIPPQFTNVDGGALAAEIATLCSEMERVGSSGRHELVVLPGRDLLRRDIPTLTRGFIDVADTDALLQFMQDDLTDDAPLATLDLRRGGLIQVFTQRAVYEVRPLSEDSRLGRIIGCRARRASDGAIDATPITARIHVTAGLTEAQDRIARTAGGAMAWAAVAKEREEEAGANDPVEWHALIMIEVATLLEARLRHYPVEIVDSSENGVVRIAARDDTARDEWRAIFKLGEAADELQRDMLGDDGSVEWTLTASETLTVGRSAPKLSFEDIADADGRRLYVFRYEGTLPAEELVLLTPRSERGTETSVRRRLRHVAAARGNLDLLHAIGDPRSVGLDPALIALAPIGDAPAALDPSKIKAWEAIRDGHALNLIVGPPGVGKSFLISRLIGSILAQTPSARILVSAQNHEALAQMERILREHLSEVGRNSIIVRVEKPAPDLSETRLQVDARSLLSSFALGKSSPLIGNRRVAIEAAARGAASGTGINPEGEAILRDTEHLILRSADVTLATANSPVIEQMVAEGEQFDWVIVEEAARASGSELIGPLLLGNRRVLIGDHRQLAPFDAERKARLYGNEEAEALLEGAPGLIEAISDIPDEVGASLATLAADRELFADVLGAALRLEQPFREIAETAEAVSVAAQGGPVSMLTEQSRMHPTICELVSNTFYGGRLTTAERILGRVSPIASTDAALAAPLVLFDLPPLSKARAKSFETFDRTSPFNRAEAIAVLEALDRLKPVAGPAPTLAILSPYAAQCRHLEQRLAPRFDRTSGRLSGFACSKGDGKFIHTIDSFQGGEADLVIVSTVRNNQKVGRPALGILGNRQRMNVLLSRARHKLVLVTSMGFLRNAVQWSEGGRGSVRDFDFLSAMLRQIDQMARAESSGSPPHASIIACDEQGRVA